MTCQEAADAIFKRIAIKAVDADIGTLERLASAFKLTREGLAYAPQDKPVAAEPPAKVEA